MRYIRMHVYVRLVHMYAVRTCLIFMHALHLHMPYINVCLMCKQVPVLMYALHICTPYIRASSLCTPYIYVCLTCMCALYVSNAYVCLICMPYMTHTERHPLRSRQSTRSSLLHGDKETDEIARTRAPNAVESRRLLAAEEERTFVQVWAAGM